MELIEIQQKIEEKIKKIEEYRAYLKSLAKDKAIAIGQYERALAKTIAELRTGQVKYIDNIKIEKPVNILIEKIAKGLTWEEKQAMEITEYAYKNCILNINAVEAELNGYQSIYRYSSYALGNVNK